ncbi:L-desosaminyltransferase [Thermomonospora echinospora]|uniref:L-desosaminyltransferase n=1 Tax=Thermomonospora echinospora TaxID=1992 RepID=A0A1H5TSI0_9ACTN|nr:activator-dependent family glycosyltransferase [Thermomonospora echinospora]SEF65743.1 L-desosaminyltransferase [Thermomonospora echinospora]
MKVMFASLEGSHFQLMVPMAWALRTAGHQVRVVCKRGLVDAVAQAGLTAVPVDCPPWQEGLGRFHQEALARCNELETTELERIGPKAPGVADAVRARPTWETLLAYESLVVPALWARLNRDEMIDGLVEYARFWQPDLVLWESFCMGGPVAALACGAAHARMVSGPDMALQMGPRREFVRRLRELPPENREDPTADWLDWTLERVGCDRRFDETMLTGQWIIDSRPPSMREDLGVPTVPVRYVPYNGRCVVPAWLREPPPDRPRVCLTLGTSIDGDYALFDLNTMLNALMRTLADMEIEVVAAIAAKQRALLRQIPDNVRVVDFVPIDDLLPTCAAVVHHGGYQTKATAELHGVPQVIVTGWEWVSEGMGRDYEGQGTLLSIPLREFTAELLRERLERVLEDPSFAANAMRVREELLAMRTPNDIVPTIERLTAERLLEGIAC